MWRSHAMAGLRTFGTNRTYAFVTVIGLALAFAAAILLFVFVRGEHGYDRFWSGYREIYQLQTLMDDANDAIAFTDMQKVPRTAALAFESHFTSEIEAATMVIPLRATLFRGARPESASVNLVDADFLKVFPFAMVAGDSATALAAPDAILFSESEARRRFGSVDIVGRTVDATLGRHDSRLRVTGVYRDLPPRSTIAGDIFIRYDRKRDDTARDRQADSKWTHFRGYAYLRLRSPEAATRIAHATSAWERSLPSISMGERRFRAGALMDWRLIPLTDVHLGVVQGSPARPGYHHKAVDSFTLIALLILGMALLNYINLATARASQRAREVALRKALGATRGQLVAQFLSESIVVVTIAALVGLALAMLGSAPASTLIGTDLEIVYFGRDGILLPVIVTAIIIGIMGGLYPAVHLSRFNPATVLKANRAPLDGHGTGLLRTLLVIAQFVVAIGLIACTIVIIAQTRHARTADVGFDRSNIIQLEGFIETPLAGRAAEFADLARHLPGIEAAAATAIAVGTNYTIDLVVRSSAIAEPVHAGLYSVQPDFFQVIGARLVAGRFLDNDVPGDNIGRFASLGTDAAAILRKRGLNAVVNASAARKLGYVDPADAIGQHVATGLPDIDGHVLPLTIVGVIEDARFRSAKNAIQPMIFVGTGDNLYYIIVRHPAGQAVAARRSLERLWRSFAPHSPIDATTVATRVDLLYSQDTARNRLLVALAALTTIIACLGLFGLASFTAERRVKEIGIRKALGAKTRDIMRLLLWQFSKPVLIANLIAWPIAWWAMRGWLAGFDDGITLGPVPFVMAGTITLVIALATIALHTLKVARASPIIALRYE